MHRQVENQNVESYLAEVESRCISIPKPRRDDEFKEMRQHLLSAVSAYQKAGQSEVEAVERALSEFGTTEEASANLLWTWQRLLRKNGLKTFWKIEGIWSALAAFNILFASNSMEGQMRWFYFWVCVMVVGFLLIVLPPYLPSKSQLRRIDSRRL